MMLSTINSLSFNNLSFKNLSPQTLPSFGAKAKPTKTKPVTETLPADNPAGRGESFQQTRSAVVVPREKLEVKTPDTKKFVPKPRVEIPLLPEKMTEQLLAVAKTRTLSFRKEFQGVLDKAKAYLQEFAQTNDPQKSAVVFDLDETLIDNVAYEITLWSGQNPYKYKPDWQKTAEAPLIPETKTFMDWCRDKGFKIYFISGRKEYLREATVKNLSNAGVTPEQYETLYMKRNDAKFGDTSMSVFKVEKQQEIEASGIKVAALLGDQQSDIEGCLGRGFKLPNPVYFVP
jgi:hypothetical protein